MKKMKREELIKRILNFVVTVLTAAITSLGTSSCMIAIEPQTPPPQYGVDASDVTPVVTPIVPRVVPNMNRDYHDFE